MVTTADAAAQAANAASGAQADTASQRVVDQGSARDRASVSDVVTGQDVNADERLKASGADHSEANFRNEKRTYDLHQTLDTEALLFARRTEIVEAEQRRKREEAENQMRLRHANSEFEQRLRHADFQVTAMAAITGEMVEAIANKVADRVIVQMSKSA